MLPASDDEIAIRRAESESETGSYDGWISSLDVDKDGSYDTNVEMYWVFYYQTNGYMLLEFLYIDIEMSDDCEADVLRVVR